MIVNRLCDAGPKLGTLRWLQTVAMPGVDPDNLTHQHLLCSMDALITHQQAVDDCVSLLLRPLIDDALSVAFYDRATIRAGEILVLSRPNKVFDAWQSIHGAEILRMACQNGFFL